MRVRRKRSTLVSVTYVLYVTCCSEWAWSKRPQAPSPTQNKQRLGYRVETSLNGPFFPSPTAKSDRSHGPECRKGYVVNMANAMPDKHDIE